MNAFSGYVPQLSWSGHDKGHQQSISGTKGAAALASKIKLPGSLNGKVLMMDIPSRDSINTQKKLQRDRSDMIKRGGI